MLAQAERLIAERAHNRLTPAEREEFFEQLARLKLTLADADAEAEVQAVEREEPRPQAAPVAQERLKEMALALSVRERPAQPPGPAGQAPREAADQTGSDAAEPRSGVAPAEDAQAAPPLRDAAPPEQEAGGRGTEPGAASRGRDRLVLPRAGADQAVQALAIGGLARRRNRAVTWAAAASAAAASEAAGRSAYAPAGPAAADLQPQTQPGEAGREAAAGAAGGEPSDPERPERAAEPHGGNGAAAEAEAPAKGARRARKPKRQGLPEGWVIDEEGFVVPGGS
jgi:ribonuclease E